MSPLGKILLYIALVGAAVAIVFGYFDITAYDAQTAVLTQTKADVQSQMAKTKKVQAEADAATAAQAQAETELAEQKSKVDDLNSKLADAESKQTTLQAAVQTATDTATKAQAELTRIAGVLKNEAPEEVMAKIDKLNQQVAADNAEQKILQDQLQAASKQVADLKTEINASKVGSMPPGISGKVTFVNTTWNFVVLNVGLSNGVVPNGELVVYRGKDFLGKVKVTSAEDNTAVADIIPGSKADIQVGDDVLN
jgi:multidrug efflux pump subunit AcrA (membrane-fusion protein)